MSDIKPAKIFSDEPVLEPGSKNFFHFQEYANTISDIIAFKENQTPLTIGIYGSWGTGKTSLMRLIAHNLEKNPKYDGKKDLRKCKTVWFQAWRYAEEDHILAALIEQIFRTMESDNLLENIKARAEKITKSLSERGVVSQLFKLATAGTLDITEFFGELKHKDMLPFVDTFDDFFLDLVYCYVRGIKYRKGQSMDDKKGALAIFIDDLDRCPKDRIPKVLEAIKLFLDKPGCVFVIGADMDIIKDALVDPYKDGADRFMEKIVQLSFTLPKMDDTSGEEFLSHLNKDETLAEIAPLLLGSLEHNPRRIKRLINDYNFMLSLAENRYVGAHNPIQSGSLLRWLVILTVYPKFAKLLRQSWAYSGIIQQKIGELEKALKPDEVDNWRVETRLGEMDTIGLEEFLKDRDFVSLIKGFPTERAEVEPYISFIASVMVAEEKREEPEEEATEFDKYSKPIPAGTFTLADTGEEIAIEHEYEMGIFPVTNSQYRRFMEAGGYEKRDFWSDEGWKWRKEKGIIQPEHWNDDKWNQPDCPVVGVSWYEAHAYCNWLSASGQGKYAYRLPTEAEWERAAGGDEKRPYPWGTEFDKEKCNTSESGIGKTTPVNRYPQGLSPSGCYDMAGNVWEWTCSNFDTKKQRTDFILGGIGPVTRGGSWYNVSDGALCASRSKFNPGSRLNDIGFRCVRTKK